MIKALFFDFDGVILESVNAKTEAFAAMYEPYGPEVRDRVVEYHMLHGGVSRFEKIRHYQAEFLGDPVDEDRLQELCGRFAELALDKVMSSPFVPGALEFLEERSGAYRCFVVSGTPEDELRGIVHSKGLERYFEGVYGAPDKKADIVARLLEELGMRPDETAFIGDAMTDHDAALSNGTRFIGRVPNGEPNRFPAGTVIIQRLDELEAILGGY